MTSATNGSYGAVLHPTGMSLAYDIHGSADDRPPLVMLHGLTFDRRQWQPVLRKLVSMEPDRRIIAVGLPGHGELANHPSYDLGSVVVAVHAAVDKVGFAAPVVVGAFPSGACWPRSIRCGRW